MRDVFQQRHFPVEVRRLCCTVSHTESRAVVGTTHRGGQIAITHERSEDELPLLVTKKVRLGKHYAVPNTDLPGLAPSTGSADQVIRRQVEGCPPVPRPAARPLDPEVQKLFG